MKLFECQVCGQPIYFENTRCERCGHRLGYLPTLTRLSALRPEGETWEALAAPGVPQRFCANAAFDACNWLVPVAEQADYCLACRHNRTIPNLSDPQNLTRWRKIEVAKRRLFYTLLRLGLPLVDRRRDPERGLAFDFLVDRGDAEDRGDAVMTGHASGLITINAAEADEAERERRRTAMDEPYRTLLGHFRHEVGHHYWDLLVADTPQIEPCRALFGDERQDYGAALERHYRDGPPADWQDGFISSYATAHPWEDFAETWAHYLHIVDTLETAMSFGLSVKPRIAAGEWLTGAIDFDPYGVVRIDDLIRAWLPLSAAVNSLNRSMGQPDLYPFVLAPTVVGKLGFIHDLVRRR